MSVDVAVTVAPNNVAAQFDGPPGGQGTTGQTGGAIPVPYTFSTATTSTDPGSGGAKLNQAVQNTATAAYVSNTGADLATWGPIFAQIAAVTSLVKGWLRVAKTSDATKWALFKITALTNNSTYYTLTLANVASSAASPFANSDALSFHFTPIGDLGPAAAPISIPYAFSTTTTSGNPGAGVMRLGNATENLSVAAYLSTTDSNAVDWSLILSSMGSSTSAVKGYLRVTKVSDATKFITFQVTSAVLGGAGWYSLVLAPLVSSAASPFANNDPVVVSFDRNGDALPPYRNRFINGDMRIDQRAAGASSTPAATGYFSVDRWLLGMTQASKLTIGQNLGAVALPAGMGFTNYLGIKTAVAVTVGASDTFYVEQPIEGFNVADLMWGTANALPFTKSFWVQSSITGTHGGVIKNSANNRSYPFTFSIPVANTWTLITVTIPGDTSGVWATDKTVGLYAIFGLGVGTTFSGTAGAWAATNMFSATGAVSVVGTLNATFYVTGVQGEAGSIATSYERRPLALEMILCQRYHENNMPTGSAEANAIATGFAAGGAYATNTVITEVVFSVEKRNTPSVTLYRNSSGAVNGQWSILTAGAVVDLTSSSATTATTKRFQVTGTATLANGTYCGMGGGWAADAELT